MYDQREMDRTTLRFVDAVFSDSVGPALVAEIYADIKDNKDTLLKHTALAVMKRAYLEKSERVIGVLQREVFCYFSSWILPDTPLSFLFFFEHCLLTGILIIQISKEDLVAKIVYTDNDSTFVRLKHSKEDNYSWDTVNRLLQLCTKKTIGLINVVIDGDVERHIDFHQKRSSISKFYACKKPSHFDTPRSEFYLFMLCYQLPRFFFSLPS